MTDSHSSVEIENELKSLRKENQWLKLELEMFRKEQKQFSSDQNLAFGTDAIPSIVPPIAKSSLRNTVSSPSLAGYLLVADGWQSLLSWLLKEDTIILDIGCGCGKLTRFFLHHPFIKKCIGIDNYEKSIQWCQEYIQPLAPEKFQFIFADVLSEAYNPAGKILGKNFIFPVEEATTDLVIAASLFTHLLEEDTLNYLKQIKRALKKNGVLVVSIHTDTVEDQNYSGNEIRIDVKVDYFVKLAEDSGLVFKQYLGKLLGQDILLFNRS